ncbi:MAG: hypothetical protein ACLFUJ_10485 [Phycisphaerae bacterium]
MKQHDIDSARLHRQVRSAWLVGIWAALAVLLAVNLYFHEMWRDELQALGVARAASNPVELLTETIRYEGHPGLYHLVLWAGSRLTDSPNLLKVVNWVFCAATMGLLLWRAPFPLWVRMALCCSYVLLYEFGTISRAYSLAALLAVGILCLHPWQRRWKWLAGAGLIFLLCQTSGYGAALAGALVAGMTIDHLRTHGYRGLGRICLLLALAGVSVVLAAAQAFPPDDRHAVPSASGRNVQTVLRIGGLAAETFFPAPAFHVGYWRLNVYNAVAWPWLAILGGLLAGGFWLLWLWRLRKVPAAMWTLAIGALLMGSIAFWVLPGDKRHWGHLLLILVAGWWMGKAGGVDPLARPGSRRAGLLRGMLLVSLVLQVLAGLSASALDWFLPFSHSPRAAELIRRHVPDDAVILAQHDAFCSPVAMRLDRPMVYLNASDRPGTWILWIKGRGDTTDPDALTAARRWARSDRAVWLLSSFRLSEKGTEAGWQLEGSAQGPCAVGEEQFWLYRLAPGRRE